MLPLEMLIKGAIAGLAISAPVGPVNVFCISRAVAKGRRAGMIAGIGAAAADTIYGAIAGFSISYIIHFLIKEEFWIRLVGGSLLIAIGVLYFFRPPKALEPKRSSPGSDLVAAFVLNLTNPTTVLSFLAVLAALHLGGQHGWESLYLVAGIFAGGMAWWIFLSLIAAHFRERFGHGAMYWMNRVAGIAIGAFGIVTVILSRAS
ncbi:MAG TPA: LysE family transporter [Bryobacteraceae bacterium]|nr:LysE family transporter [Bryobacteraceae bacterium]